MENEEEFIFPLAYHKIPKIFWSDLTSKPFDKCVMCETYLLEDGTDYLIEKAFKKYKGVETVSTIFEYAICFNCHGKMTEMISKESIERIDIYFKNNVDFDKRRIVLEEKLNVKDWLKECIVHKKEPTEDGEYQIYAMCNGEDIVFHEMPFMIRGEAIDSFIDLMSEKTKDELGGFMDDLTSGPPELRALLESGGVKVFI